MCVCVCVCVFTHTLFSHLSVLLCAKSLLYTSQLVVPVICCTGQDNLHAAITDHREVRQWGHAAGLVGQQTAGFLPDQDLPSQYRQVRIGVMLLVVVTVEVCKIYNCWCGMTGLTVQQTYGVLSDLDQIPPGEDRCGIAGGCDCSGVYDIGTVLMQYG